MTATNSSRAGDRVFLEFFARLQGELPASFPMVNCSGSGAERCAIRAWLEAEPDRIGREARQQRSAVGAPALTLSEQHVRPNDDVTHW